LSKAGASLLLVLTVLLAFCGQAPAPEESETPQEAPVVSADMEEYALTGRILGLREEEKTAVIMHDEIVGWMSAMTMDFPIRDDAEWKKLKVGSKIEATVFASDDGFYVGKIKVVEEDSE
jgi:Cu/Ag efflux protein CusF